jgi:hypothetical protein
MQTQLYGRAWRTRRRGVAQRKCCLAVAPSVVGQFDQLEYSADGSSPYWNRPRRTPKPTAKPKGRKKGPRLNAQSHTGPPPEKAEGTTRKSRAENLRPSYSERRGCSSSYGCSSALAVEFAVLAHGRRRGRLMFLYQGPIPAHFLRADWIGPFPFAVAAYAVGKVVRWAAWARDLGMFSMLL